jgi:hypothetical protein
MILGSRKPLGRRALIELIVALVLVVAPGK